MAVSGFESPIRTLAVRLWKSIRLRYIAQAKANNDDRLANWVTESTNVYGEEDEEAGEFHRKLIVHPSSGPIVYPLPQSLLGAVLVLLDAGLGRGDLVAPLFCRVEEEATDDRAVVLKVSPPSLESSSIASLQGKTKDADYHSGISLLVWLSSS